MDLHTNFDATASGDRSPWQAAANLVVSLSSDLGRSSFNIGSVPGFMVLILGAIPLLLLLNYAQTVLRYHHADRSGAWGNSRQGKPAQRPPLYPSLIPFIGSAIAFSYNNAEFLRRAT